MRTAGSSAIQLGAGAATDPDTPRYVEPRLTLALNEVLALDASFYVLLDDAMHSDPMFLGSLGVHGRWIQRPAHGWRASLGLGPAVGRGGRMYDDGTEEWSGPPLPENPVADEFAFGGFLSGNLAYRINRHIELYAGNRLDVIEATPNPRTRWQAHSLGLQLHPSSRLFLSMELILLLYENEMDRQGMIAAGASVGGQWDR